jgi:hypothetical protein
VHGWQRHHPISAAEHPCRGEKFFGARFATQQRPGMLRNKHDGFRVIARKDGDRVRLYSRPGNDLTYRYIDRKDGRGLAR